MKLLVFFPILILLTFSGDFTIALDNGVARTPAMGWSTWNYFFTEINESLVKEIAQSFIDSGLHDLGWEYINIDGGWALPERDSNGHMQPDPKLFPSGMKSLGEFIHSLGLKFGLYTDISNGTCAGAPGGYGHYTVDAGVFADWGVDYLKVDYCGRFGDSNLTQWEHWAGLRDALNATGRPIYYSICPKTVAPPIGNSAPYRGQEIYSAPLNWSINDHRNVANSWLVEYVNIVDNWYSPSEENCVNAGAPCGMITNLDAIAQMTEPYYPTPGGWNDADMLQVCNLGHHNGGMSNVEYRASFSLWSVLSSPLILSMDLRNWNQSELRECLQFAVMNKEVIAVNQDAGGFGGSLLYEEGNSTATITQQVWGKPLESGEWAVVLLNRAAKELEIRVNWTMVGWMANDQAHVRDIWPGVDIGVRVGGYSTTVVSHGVTMLRLTRDSSKPWINKTTN